MNPKLRIISILAASALFTSQHALAQAGSRGGEVVRTTKGTQLLDVIDHSTCAWTSGPDLVKQYPLVLEALEELKSIHWYFGFAIEREMKNIDYCFTDSRLKRPSHLVDDPEVLPYYQTPKEPTEIVGVRLFESRAVYLNRPLFEGLNPKQQALLFIHETLHTFLAADLPARNDKIHTVLQAIQSIWEHLPMTASSFATTLTRNGVSFPRESSPSFETPYLNYVLSGVDTRRNLILNDQVTAEFLLKSRVTSLEEGELLESDQQYLNSITQNLPENLFGYFCRKKDMAVIQKLEKQSSDAFDIDELCLRYPIYSGDQNLKKAVIQKALERNLGKLFKKLNHVQVKMSGSRIEISKEIEAIIGNPDASTRARLVMQLYPFISYPGKTATSDTQAMIDFMTKAAQIMSVDEWVKTILANGAFESSFDSKRLVQEINRLPNLQGGERDDAASYLPTLYTSFKNALVAEIRAHISDEYADALQKAILTTGVQP